MIFKASTLDEAVAAWKSKYPGHVDDIDTLMGG